MKNFVLYLYSDQSIILNRLSPGNEAGLVTLHTLRKPEKNIVYKSQERQTE